MTKFINAIFKTPTDPLTDTHTHKHARALCIWVYTLPVSAGNFCLVR